jgi:CRP-like cAMP-binding protein
MAARTKANMAEVLGQSVLLRGLTRKQLNAVAKAALERSFDAGDVIVRQVDHGQRMVVLLSGTATVATDGRRIAKVRAGDAVGEMSLIDGHPCSASVVADTPVEAIVLYRTAFRRLLAEVPAISQRLLLAQTARIRELDKRAAALG